VKYVLIAAIAALSLSSAAHGATTVVNFDAVPTGDFVNGFYSGGTSSSGATGPNLGVTFARLRTLTGAGETSRPNFLVNFGEQGQIDTNFSFTGLSFNAGFFLPGTVSVFSGPGGTGTLLGSLSGVLGNTTAFTRQVVAFNGLGRSVTIVGASSSLGFDDFTFTLAGGVPEPSTWIMMGVGFGLIGGAMRRRKRKTAFA
jgi:PEP-CTERM motif